MERIMNDLNLPRGRKPPLGLVAIGLAVISFGGIMLLGGLGIIDPWSLIHGYWPIPFIVIGIASFLQSRNWGTLIWIAVPAIVYAKQHRWIDFNIFILVPAILTMFAGGAILYRAFIGPLPRPQTVTQTDEYLRSFAIFSGTDLRPSSQLITGGEITSVLGGVKIDLSTADIPSEGAVLDMFVVLGGVELHVPSNWNVKLELKSILTGISDERRPTVEEKTKTLTLRGIGVLCGVEVRN
jgi:predicted membrane protein